MPLRLHVRHSLGDDEHAFDDRYVSHPLTIGRSPEADLRIPNVHLSPRHVAFFVHEGAWVVQDGGSERGSYLNGEPIDGPRVVAAGDVVTLGPPQREPPALTILDATTTAMIAEPAEPPGLPAAPVATADFYAADPAVTFPVSPHASRRARAQSSSAALWVVAAVMTLAFLVAAVLVLRHKRQQAMAPAASAATPATVEGVAAGQGSVLFDAGGAGAAATRPASTPPATAPDPVARPGSNDRPRPPAASPSPVIAPPPEAANANGPPASMFSDDPRRRHPDWIRVEDAARTASPAQALAVFADYRARHPDSPLLGAVAAMEDETLNRLWWQRLQQLVERRDRLAARRDARREDLRDIRRSAPDRQRLAELEAQLAELETDLAEAARTLEEEMGYRGAAFDAFDEQAVADRRRSRDAAKYAEWSRHVLSHVRRTRGALPW